MADFSIKFTFGVCKIIDKNLPYYFTLQILFADSTETFFSNL